MSAPVSITACYAFFALEKEQLNVLRDELVALGKDRDMRGLVLISTEGINATVCGTKEAISAWKARMRVLHPEIAFKDSVADKQIFRRWRVKVKEEIVALHRPEISPSGKHKHVSPAQWHDMLTREDVVLLDARNSYEARIGAFPNAIDPGTRSFYEFPQAIAKVKIPKDKTILMYCTGGIRCEKALLVLEEQGYQDVRQLDGGILAYLEQFPDGKFNGECFVFDERVAVDNHLQPSRRYVLCPATGDPVPV